MQKDSNKQMDIRYFIHFNSFIFLIFAHCTHRILKGKCFNESSYEFLNLVYYGNLVLYISFFIFYLLYISKLLNRLFNACGAVIVALETFGAIIAVYTFEIICMYRGLTNYYLSEHSKCQELELFTMVCAYLYSIWIFVSFIGFVDWYIKYKKRTDPTRLLA